MKFIIVKFKRTSIVEREVVTKEVAKRVGDGLESRPIFFYLHTDNEYRNR